MSRRQAEALAKNNASVRARLEAGEFDGPDNTGPDPDDTRGRRGRSKPPVVRAPRRDNRAAATGRGRAATRSDEGDYEPRERRDGGDGGGFFRGLFDL